MARVQLEKIKLKIIGLTRIIEIVKLIGQRSLSCSGQKFKAAYTLMTVVWITITF